MFADEIVFALLLLLRSAKNASKFSAARIHSGTTVANNFKSLRLLKDWQEKPSD